MPFSVSPAVNTTEKSLAAIVPGVATSIGAYVGAFRWGPANQIFTIGSENELVDIVHKPDDDTAQHFFVSAGFLSYANALRLVRVTGDDAQNAASGGDGTGLQLDVTAVNGIATAVAITAGHAGTNYIVGDVVLIPSSVADAHVRVTGVSAVGAVTSVSLQIPGEGIVSGTGVATTIVNSIYVDNDDDLANDTIYPEIIARYPGALGNSISFSSARASEFEAWSYKNRFAIAPTASSWKWSGNATNLTFALPSGNTALPSDAVVVVDGIRRYSGANPGQYGVTSGNLVFVEATENFVANGSTAKWTLTNANVLDPSQARMIIDSVEIQRYDELGAVPAGKFKVAGNVVEYGTSKTSFGGDGVTTVFTIVGVTGIDDAKVLVNGVAKTVKYTGVVAAGEAVLTTASGNTIVTLHASEVPTPGVGNVTVEWGFPDNLDAVVVKYGAPKIGTNNVKVFYNQTEIHAVVIDEAGEWTGESEALLERYDFLSLTPGKKFPDGTTSYYVDSINRRSRYVRIPSELFRHDTKRLTGGVDDNSAESITPGKIQNGLNLFVASDEVDVSHVILGAVTAETVVWTISNLVEYRKDCVTYFSPPFNAVVNNRGNEVDDIIAFRDLLPSSSYAHFDSNWKYVYDRYNDKYRWVPCSGDSAGIYSATHTTLDPWWSGGGFNRGRLKNVVKLAWSANKAARDDLYAAGVNPIHSFRGEGPILFGDKTLLKKPDAFDRMNIRWLFIVLEKAISTAAKYFLFEFNDEFTRNQFVNLVHPFLRDVMGRRGIEDFKIVCDDTNNPGSVRQRKEFVGDIYIKPAHAINFIQLNFTAVGSDVSFDEIINNVRGI